MGTSLSGLTPATTFDGLLKVGDNDPLTSELKAISTGDGTDTMLELSTTALQIGGATGMYWDNTNKRLGIATDAPSVPFEVYGGVRFRDNLNLNGTLSNSSTGEVNINNLGFFDAVSSKVGIGENTPTSRLHIKGEGATSATTSLLVQNSDGDDMFSVRDDGKINADNDFYVQGAIYGGSNTKLRVGTDLNIASTRAWIQGLGATSATTSLLVQNSDGTEHLKVTDDGVVNVRSTLYVNHPTTSSRYLSLGWGSVAANDTASELSIYGGGGINGSIMYLNGSTKGTVAQAIGMKTSGVLIAESMVQSSFAPSAQLHVKGSGATSATTSLLVENSDGTEHLKITDDGFINARQSIIVNHATNSSRSLRLGWGSVFATDNASELLIGAVFSQNTAPRITLGGKTRASGADAVIVQALNGMYLSTTAYTEDPSAQLHVKGSGNDNTTTSLLVQNSDGTDLLKVLDDGKLSVSSSVAGGLFATFENTSSTGFGLDIKAGVSSSNYTLQWRNYVGAGGGRIYPDGVIIGTQSTPSARLHIKGSGATSATTALLVENSAGTDTLEVRDDGRVVTGKGATTNANGTFNVLHGVSNLTTRVFTVSRDSVLRGMDINSGGATKISDSSGDQSFSHTATAVLEVSSTTQGFLPPRMTGTQRDAIESPASGLIIYNTTTNKAQCYNGTDWNDMF